MDLLIYIWTFS